MTQEQRYSHLIQKLNNPPVFFSFEASFYVNPPPCQAPAATATVLIRASACKKKGSSYTADIVETEKSFVSTVVMEVPAAEPDGKCKCGAGCTCTDCTCGH
ncbi:hypothetical protein P3X46_027015 [Hevea brasiliensis]|uniref:Metallothionein-like protein n=1 Tax=Hevea brasiliensis TaxID=3981 RepID=A0ABQ9KZM6_HEVBR|nr:hypothetical protein P3X46_027015 [Hevea brasiliensis]